MNPSCFKPAYLRWATPLIVWTNHKATMYLRVGYATMTKTFLASIIGFIQKSMVCYLRGPLSVCVHCKNSLNTMMPRSIAGLGQSKKLKFARVHVPPFPGSSQLEQTRMDTLKNSYEWFTYQSGSCRVRNLHLQTKFQWNWNVVYNVKKKKKWFLSICWLLCSLSNALICHKILSKNWLSNCKSSVYLFHLCHFLSNLLR